MLTREQIEFYHREGYVAVPNVFPLAMMEELRAVTEGFVEQSRTATQHTEVFDLEPGHSAKVPRLRRLKDPVKHHEAYMRTLRWDPMLDVVAQLISPGIRYQNTKLNLKSGEIGSAVEWHQDWAFYPHTNSNVLAVGVCIDDMMVENGALMVIPRSHKGPLLDHHQDGHFVGAITDPHFSEEGAVPLEVRTGGITIHHAMAIHGSAPNRSNRQRRLLLFEFRANDAWPMMGVKDWPFYESQILRGESCLAPRVEVMPVRIPLPPTPTTGSIYESQTYLKRKVMAVR